jgi:hypothetical protein
MPMGMVVLNSGLSGEKANKFKLYQSFQIITFRGIVVLSSDIVGVFCLPNSTKSEKNFYVIRDQKALESVQNYRSVMTS